MTPEAEAAGHSAGHVRGMPQLFFDTYPNQIFWLVITLVVIWWVLSRIALPRIGAVLAERAGTITNDIAAAEEFSLKVKDADTEIAAKAAESEKAIAEIRAQSLDAIRDVANSTAAEIVSALGGTPDAKAISGAIADKVKG